MQVICGACSEPFEAKRSSAKWCGETCRKRGARAPAVVEPAVPADKNREAVRAAGKSFEAATLAELESLNSVDTLEGRQLLYLASRMSNPAETGAAAAALSREFSRLMDELRARRPKADAVDEVRAKRDRIAREAAR